MSWVINQQYSADGNCLRNDALTGEKSYLEGKTLTRKGPASAAFAVTVTGNSPAQIRCQAGAFQGLFCKLFRSLQHRFSTICGRGVSGWWRRVSFLSLRGFGLLPKHEYCQNTETLPCVQLHSMEERADWGTRF